MSRSIKKYFFFFFEKREKELNPGELDYMEEIGEAGTKNWPDSILQWNKLNLKILFLESTKVIIIKT